jgi:hypothetical protein
MRMMSTIHFDPQHLEAKSALIPKGQEHIRSLMSKGLVEAVYVSADRTMVWLPSLQSSPQPKCAALWRYTASSAGVFTRQGLTALTVVPVPASYFDRLSVRSTRASFAAA